MNDEQNQPTASQIPETGSMPKGDQLLGSEIGQYKILQVIGEGGMGTVYMAEQEVPVKRRVALKIIKPGMDTKQVIARFEAERQALSMMDHPNIAHVLDVGTTEAGRPYFVMELVKGLPITKYCDETKLTVPQRLELFKSICNAVQHAHQKGIIHRDLKPSNILVAEYDGEAVAKIIDFGLAKALHQRLTEKTMFTQLGQVVGTFEYMSPEQSRMNQLDVDTRTDIYSLGVILYELLTGTTPIDKERLRSAALDQILKIIREEEPPKPSTKISTIDSAVEIATNRRTEPRKLTGFIRGDLDWIVMKALDKDRNRRYETANGLAMDVERYLGGEPVVAAPPSTGYRMRKFIGRHRAAIAFTTVVGVLLLSATGVSAWQAIRATNAETQAIADRKIAIEQEAIANNVVAFLQEDILLQGPDAQQPGPDPKLSTVLDRASEKIEGGRFRDQPHVEATLRLTIGRSYATVGLVDKALPHLKRSYDLALEVWGDEHANTLIAMSNLAVLYKLQERYDEAEDLSEKVLRQSKHIRGPNHLETARAMDNLADVYVVRGNYGEAGRLYSDALRIYEESPTKPPAVLTLQTKNELAVVYALNGDYARAETHFRELADDLTKALNAEHPYTLTTKHNVGCSLQEQGKHDMAETVFLEVLAARRRVLPPGHPDIFATLEDLVRNYLQQKKFPEAENSVRECIDICAQHEMLSDSWHYFHAQNMLGGAIAGQNKFEEAEDFVVDGYNGMKQREDKIPASDQARLTEALERIPNLYDAWHAANPNNGYDIKAADWKKKLDEHKAAASSH